jgi:hypothetical protein
VNFSDLLYLRFIGCIVVFLAATVLASPVPACTGVLTPLPCPTGAPRFVGADAADLAAPRLLADRQQAPHHTARECGDYVGHTPRGGQSGPSRPKPTVGWADMAFRPGRHSRPPDHEGFGLRPDSAQRPVIFLFQF